MKANTPLKLIDGKLFESPTNYNFVEKKKLLTTITGSPIEIARTSQCTIENFTQLQDVVLISTDKEESSAKKTFNYFTKEWLFDDDKVTEQFFLPIHTNMKCYLNTNLIMINWDNSLL